MVSIGVDAVIKNEQVVTRDTKFALFGPVYIDQILKQKVSW